MATNELLFLFLLQQRRNTVAEPFMTTFSVSFLHCNSEKRVGEAASAFAGQSELRFAVCAFSPRRCYSPTNHLPAWLLA